MSTKQRDTRQHKETARKWRLFASQTFLRYLCKKYIDLPSKTTSSRNRQQKQQKKTSSQLKMDKGLRYIFLQIRCMANRYMKKTLNVINHKGSINKNGCEMSPHIYENGRHYKDGRQCYCLRLLESEMSPTGSHAGTLGSQADGTVLGEQNMENVGEDCMTSVFGSSKVLSNSWFTLDTPVRDFQLSESSEVGRSTLHLGHTFPWQPS